MEHPALIGTQRGGGVEGIAAQQPGCALPTFGQADGVGKGGEVAEHQKLSALVVSAVGQQVFVLLKEELDLSFADQLAFFAQGHQLPVERKDGVGVVHLGGYGAWFLALSRPDLYGKAAAMSGALDIVATYEGGKAGAIDSPFPWTNIFADPEHLEGSKADLFALYEADRASGCVPALYHACGRSDFLYEMNKKVHQRLEAMGADVPFTEGEGGHEWDYWDKTIREILPWLCEG